MNHRRINRSFTIFLFPLCFWSIFFCLTKIIKLDTSEFVVFNKVRTAYTFDLCDKKKLDKRVKNIDMKHWWFVFQKEKFSSVWCKLCAINVCLKLTLKSRAAETELESPQKGNLLNFLLFVRMAFSGRSEVSNNSSLSYVDLMCRMNRT